MIEKYLLYVLAAVMLVSALGVVTVRNVFHAALLLGVTLLGIAGTYLLLNAEFLAAVQVLIYVGGILTLILFAVMLTKKISDKNIVQSNEQKATAFIISALTLAMMVYAIVKTPFDGRGEAASVAGADSIGKALFTQYVLPFEIVSVLLLIALVGSIVIARKEGTQ